MNGLIADQKENSKGKGFGLVCGDCRKDPCQCLPVPSVAKIAVVAICVILLLLSIICYCKTGHWFDLETLQN